jgi:hypothetical protein
MKKFKVRASELESTYYTVFAENEEEAEQSVLNGKFIDYRVIRHTFTVEEVGEIHDNDVYQNKE